MALFGLAPEVMKPTALVLNLVVATVGTIRFARAGHFAQDAFWPFTVLSIPCAFHGGAMKLPIQAYKFQLGFVLLFAAWRLAFKQSSHTPALALGAGLGFLSGLTGVGGGSSLSPLMLFLSWADVRKTAGVLVVFIQVNSASRLLGHLASVKNVPHEIARWAPAALIGVLIGSELGSRRLAPMTMRRLVALVPVVAGVKILLAP